MSLCLLLLGRFEEGWQAYEHRFEVPGHDRRPDGAVVLNPDRVTGKRVLILTEQGRGDMLQCIRHAPLLAERGQPSWCRPTPIWYRCWQRCQGSPPWSISVIHVRRPIW
jgi:hypothetical protein